MLSDDCPDVKDIDKEVVKNYQQIVGSLMYMVAWTHPEISFAVQQCAKYMSNPGPSHIKAAKRVLSYLKGVKHMGLTYKRDSHSPNQLYGFADAHWCPTP